MRKSLLLTLMCLMTACSSSMTSLLKELAKEVDLPAELQTDVDVYPVSRNKTFRYPLKFEPFRVTHLNPGTKRTKYYDPDLQILPTLDLKFDRTAMHRHYTFELLDDSQNAWVCDCVWNGGTDESNAMRVQVAASTVLECKFRGGEREEWRFEYRDVLTYTPRPRVTGEGRLSGPDSDLRVDYLYPAKNPLVGIDVPGGYLFSADGGPVAGLQFRVNGEPSRLTVKSGIRSEERTAIAAATAALALGEGALSLEH